MKALVEESNATIHIFAVNNVSRCVSVLKGKDTNETIGTWNASTLDLSGRRPP